MANKLTDYYCVEACRQYATPNDIRILRQFQITLDGPHPTDDIIYNKHHDIVRVALWGTNVDQLKKMAKYLLCSR